MRHSRALVVVPQERRWPFLTDLRGLDVEVVSVGTCREARNVLSTVAGISLVITDVSLPDGNWCDIFKCLIDRGLDASVVVTSSRADAILWSEVLWRGAYDLLVEPYQVGEVRRTLEGALRTSQSGFPSATKAMN
jgi:DNA-binding NtrC family response regulator